MLQKDKSVLQNYAEAIQFEWLETNGLGGWSSSSLIGCHSRRYHSLLMAATVPPAERMSLVSKLDETLITTDEKYELGTNNYGDTVFPTGYHYITGFVKKIFPEFIYEAGSIKLNKTIAMVHGENTLVIQYEVIDADQSFILELLPLLSVRDYHSLMQANDSVNPEASFTRNVFKTRTYEGTPDIYIKVPGGKYNADPHWFYHFNYAIEQYRGLDYQEDLFTPGKFSVILKKGDILDIVISTEDPGNKSGHELLLKERSRRLALLQGQSVDEMTGLLTLAADQFIVSRGENLKTVIAGYHWFTDWSRDTMISLPGLCLSTGRFTDAKKILAAFANSVSMGMLPNRFQDNGKFPEYNNVDGTLWFFIAVYKYLHATGDEAFVLHEILPVLKNIIDWHFKGTRYHIHVAEDGLLFAGEAGEQLTWMDARVDNWVVTPRMGKPVEIQALWYNALKILASLLAQDHQVQDAAMIIRRAEKAKHSFVEKFWYREGKYLYDNIDENDKASIEIRPNQLFAITLPFPLIEGEQAAAVLQIVEDQLYTPVGLRSLSKTDKGYYPVYDGDTRQRDSRYHQGTVWSWLLGPYVDAILLVAGKGGYAGKEKAIKVINDFAYHLNEGCIGSVSEIFDAGLPHNPKGCVAQAWGVAEILRVINDYKLADPGK